MNLYQKIARLIEIKGFLDEVEIPFIKKTFEKSMGVCRALEHLELAKYHLKIAIDTLIAINCFEEKERKDNE